MGGGGGGGGGVAGENVFDGKIFREPNMTALMFFGYLLRSFKRIQDPLQTNMANESSLLLLKKTPAQPFRLTSQGPPCFSLTPTPPT